MLELRGNDLAKTTPMRLMELMVLKDDIQKVLKYLGELGEFQFQQDFENQSSKNSSEKALNGDLHELEELQKVRSDLEIEDLKGFTEELSIPNQEDYKNADRLINLTLELHEKEVSAAEEYKKIQETYKEALAFSNLRVPYSELESLSFLTLRIGKIESEKFDELQQNLKNKALVIALGDDKTYIMTACSKKNRLDVDRELQKIDFVETKIPEGFKGIPENMLENLKVKKNQVEQKLEELKTERKNFAQTHKSELYHLLQTFTVGSQISAVEDQLQGTEFVYRITGWLPAYRCSDVMKDIDELTKGKASIRDYLPDEVEDVINGKEKVPVSLKHGKLVGNFERMIFSYGAPMYGTVDPTPFVAIFFTLLFGIMFGDAGQGLVFLIVGILMCLKKFKLMGWEKFGPIFVCIGVSSTIMGLLTGEFFANEEVLVPFSRWVTGLFGEPRDQILHMMPSSSPESIKRMFLFFGFTVAVGFIINTCGLIINIINQFSLKRLGKALFGKTGLTGALFFWYIIFFAVSVAFFHHKPAFYDWIIIGVTLGLTSFGEVFERLVDGERPILENGFLSAVISAIVELIEVLSSYLSNTVSFLRVGAFALAHAVLGFIINLMVGVAGPVGGIFVSILGNAIVIVLEGMIVAIQVVRLQYYEFFSKFFTETGREFKPFRFEYHSVQSK